MKRVFTRYKGESFRIGNEIVVTMRDVGPTQVKLGISTPKNIPVHREEIYRANQEKELREIDAYSGDPEHRFWSDREHLIPPHWSRPIFSSSVHHRPVLESFFS